MNIFVCDESGEKRKVKAIYKCIDGKVAKLEEDTPEYFEAVHEATLQGVVSYGT